MKTNKEKTGDSGFVYVAGISLDIVLGLVLGILTNTSVNFIGSTFNLTIYIKIIIQIILVSIVIYIMKNLSYHMHQEPNTNYSYDIMFVSVFMGSQMNFQNILQSFE